MFKSSALLASAVIAADSVNNYTGVIPSVTGGTQGDLTEVKIAVQVDQKAMQVTYDYTVGGKFSLDTSEPTNVAVGLCHSQTTADKSDCIVLQQQIGFAASVDTVNNYARRATNVSDANKVKATWLQDVVGTTDGANACGGDTITSSGGSTPFGTFTWTAPADATNLCDELSMTATKQAWTARTFQIQAKVTVAASADEATAVALLTAFKTAAATMRGGVEYDHDTVATGQTNAALALTFTETATTGASAMTTFAVAIAAVAALF